MKYNNPLLKEKVLSNLFVLATMVIFCACNGPRYVYSVSPFISPVPMEKGSTSAEAAYFTHNKTANEFNSGVNKDNGLAFTVSHMFGEKNMFFASIDNKKEQNIFPLISDSVQRVLFNGGFDSSIVKTKRYRIGAGLGHFFNPINAKGTIIPGVAASLDLHYMDLTESGTLKNASYQRFLNMYQLSFLFQYNLLFKVSDRFNLAYTGRFTLVKFFKPRTNYSVEERYYLDLSGENKVDFYPCFFSGYADFKPLKRVPFTLSCQFFNDVVFWNRLLAKSDPGRTNIKGSGIAVGARYVF